MNNYHWYLKQSFEFVAPDSQPVAIQWDMLDASLLYLLCKDGTLCRYNIGWVTYDNMCEGSDHEVAVIDGGMYFILTSIAQVVS